MACALFIDVAKSCDAVWHSGHIYKLLKLKIPTAYVQFIFSQLRGKTFIVRYARKCPKPSSVNTGFLKSSKSCSSTQIHDDTKIMSRMSVMVQLLSYLQSQYTFT